VLQGSADLETIRLALTAPMGGLGLAFGTSVAGVATSAMLGLMSTLSRRDRMLCARDLDQQIAASLRPFSLTHQRQETLKALQLQSQGLPEIAARLQALTAQMERMTLGLGEALTASQDRFQSSLQGLFGGLVAAVDQSLRDTIGRTDAALSESGRQVGAAIQPLLQEAMTSIGESIARGVQDSHQQLSRTVQDQLQALSGGFAHTAGEVAQAWQQGLRAHAQANGALLQGMQDSLGDFRREFGSTAGEVVAAMQQTSAEWSARQEAEEQARLARWSEALDQTRRRQTEALEQTGAAIIGELRGLAVTQQASLQSLTQDAAGRYAELTEQLRQAGEQAMTRQQEAMVALEEPMTRLLQLATETPDRKSVV
jgi:hypothetical protein